LSARTGGQRWAAEFGPSLDGRPPLVLDPTALDGRVLGGSVFPLRGGQFASSLASWNATTGASQWSSAGGESPAVVGGVVYSGSVDTFSGGGWVASDVRTGAVAFGGRGTTLRGSAVAGGLLYGVADGQLVAYDASGGAGCTGTAPDRRCEPLWRGEAAELGFATPAVSGGTVYVTTADGELQAYDAGGCGRATCGPRWIGPAGGQGGAVAVAEGTVFARGGDGRLYAFSAAGCGQPVCLPSWSAPTGEASGGAPAVANGVVFVGSGDGRLFAIAAAGCGSRSCRPLWSTAVAGPVHSSPAVAHGRVFVGSGGTLQAFALPDQ
jgi:outer membrane protein assembly factor BamB